MPRHRLTVFSSLLMAILAVWYARSPAADAQPPGAVTAESTANTAADSAGDDTDTGRSERDVDGDMNAQSQLAKNAGSRSSSPPFSSRWRPLIILAIGIVTVLGLIIALKINAFIALISAAMVVSLLAPGEAAVKISRVASAFGTATGNIGIVIALAAVIGTCMLDSGAADRIVRAFLNLLGERRAPIALLGSGYVLAIPVFFDTVFYLLVPLARSLHRRTAKQYLKYILAIAAGGAVTHTLVPPTPGPLLMASNLGIEIGWMIMIGALVALPAAICGLFYADICDRIMKTPMRQIGSEPEPKPLEDSQLPPLWLSLLPVILPVVMISTNTVLTTLADAEQAALLKVEEVSGWPAFERQLSEQAADSRLQPGDLILRSPKLPGEVRASLEQRSSLTAPQRAALISAINDMLGDKQFYQQQAFADIALNETALKMLAANRERLKRAETQRLNRALLESAFPESIAAHHWGTRRRQAAELSDIFGNANLALLVSTVIAMGLLFVQRKLSRSQMAQVVETSLMSGGVIILITAAGGAFGEMLKEAKVGEAINDLFAGVGQGGMTMLVLGFGVAAVLKIAQGSSTVAMITGSAMLSGIARPEVLGFHPVYLATAIGGGSLIGSWMNDSGFWIFAKMGGLTEVETLKSWTIMLMVLGFTSLLTTLLLAKLLPLV